MVRAMITNNNEKINQEAIQIANIGNPMRIINFFKEWHDGIAEKTRLDMIRRMLNSAAKANMLINGCYECLEGTEVGLIILHILKDFDEDTLYDVKMPVHVYLHIMGVIIESSLASAFIEKLVNLNLVDRFQYKFRNYLAEDESVNHELRKLVSQYMTEKGTSKTLKKLLNTLPIKPTIQSSTLQSWANI